MAAEKSENVAKLIRGSVVRNPAHALESPKSSLMNGIKGPTAVIEGRSVKDTKSIPKSKNPFFSDGGNLSMVVKISKIDSYDAIFIKE
jgi:hypothetical protein